MNNKNSILCSLHRRITIYVLCAVSLSLGCSQSPKINETVRQEAEATANEATTIYSNYTKGAVSFENKYSWQMAIDVDDEKTRNVKFVSAAKGLETARDKFLQASDKMREALNGQKVFDNELATRLSRLSNVYKQWSEMAEFERKTLQEASGMSDLKRLREKLTQAQKARGKMNDDLMSMFDGAR